MARPKSAGVPIALMRGVVRWLSWRGIPLLIVFACGLTAFTMGVSVSDRPGVGSADLPTQVYYTLGLFVLGGLDLGMPVGGPAHARSLLWFAYFAAPLITASAVIEGLIKVLSRQALMLRRMRRHVIIAGSGRLTLLILRRLRDSMPHCSVVVVELRPDCAHLEEAREAYGAHIVIGDIGSDAVLGTLRLDRAERVFLLTGNDFVNLDAATKILSMAHRLGPRTVVHVSDLGFMRAMATTRVATECVPFNTHHVAARHLVEQELQAHFTQTEALDTVVLAGFGRFGQTVLGELQNVAKGKFDRVVIADHRATRNALSFEEDIGFSNDYKRTVLDGDLTDPSLWQRIEAEIDDGDEEPTFVLGSGDDGINLRTALRLRKKYPRALVVARSFAHSSFAEEVARDAGFATLSVADLLLASMPDDWFAPTAPVGAPIPFSRRAGSVTLTPQTTNPSPLPPRDPVRHT